MENIKTRFGRFMEQVTVLDELHRLSSEILVDFMQHLEVYRRTPLQESSDFVAKVVAAAPSPRLTKYLEAGGWHEDSSRSVAAKLDSGIKGLRTHLHEQQGCVNQLQVIFEETCNYQTEVEVTAQLEDLSISIFGCDDDDFQLEEAGGSGEVGSQLSFPEYASMMALILTMVEQDMKMQCKVVEDLGLDTPSGALQTYSTMWALRPFVDDEVVQQALSWVKT